jgi:hypothetical protein
MSYLPVAKIKDVDRKEAPKPLVWAFFFRMNILAVSLLLRIFYEFHFL